MIFRVFGSPIFGTHAMYQPMDVHRGALLFGGNRWFASFDHRNNYSALVNQQSSDTGPIALGLRFNAEGSQPGPVFGSDLRTSLDMRDISDGERIVHIDLANGFPFGFAMRVTDLQTGGTGSADLFGKSQFPDTLIGYDLSQKPIYGIAGDAAGQSAGKLGHLVQTGCGEYALTYTIAPATFSPAGLQVASTLDEWGFLKLDRNANVVTRTTLRQAVTSKS